MNRAVIVAISAICACDGGTSISRTELALSPKTELDRVTAIRDVSAGEGLTNGALLAGIAESETGLVHCWSEATWACQGPTSPSCDDGPVIAGAGDGPCEDRQGGLGMFQFDGGTYEETLARDGEDILLLEGNIARAVDFVVERTIEEISAATDRSSALVWLNSIPLVAGDPLMEEWAAMIVCRYNGCCSDSALCTMRRDAYRDNAIDYFEEYGESFWNPQTVCDPIPTQGRVIDDTDPCYVHGGDPQFWRANDSGYDDGNEWTVATNLSAAANYAFWQLDFEESSTYRIEVFIDGNLSERSESARYIVVAAGGETTRVVDQSSNEGWVDIGEFDFAAGGSQHIFLGDNTGEDGMLGRKLVFDAIRVTPIDGGDGGDENDGGGGCGCNSTEPPSPAQQLLLAAIALLLLCSSRRRAPGRSRRRNPGA